MIKIAFLACVGLTLTGCTSQKSGKSGPEQVIRAYIDASTQVRSPADRSNLIKFLGGDAKSRLEAWSDDQFADAFLEQNRKVSELSFRELRRPSEREATVTYELTTTDRAQAKRTQRKIAELLDQGDGWKIIRVRSLRETVDYQNELTVP